MQLFVKTYPDSTEQELAEIRMFRKQTLQLYTQVNWSSWNERTLNVSDRFIMSFLIRFSIRDLVGER